MKPLLPVRHENRDFFACDLFDVLPYFKDDMASMEHPVFSLSTKPDVRTLYYEQNGNTLKIFPSLLGLPTIHDKDILLYCASHLHAAMKDGQIPCQTIRFTAYDFFISTNRHIGGQYYKNFEISLNRLQGVVINTNIKTGGMLISKGFGLIDGWEAIKRDQESRAIAVEIKLSDWLYNSILSNELLTISRDYFRLRKPLERRIYELTRKHCGDQPKFKMGLDKLHKKIGTTAPIRKLRAQIRAIENTNHLPDYKVVLDDDDMVTFTNRHKQKATSSDLYSLSLDPDTIEKAKKAAPGYDIYALQKEWEIWISAKGDRPKYPHAAFIAFCRKHVELDGKSERFSLADPSERTRQDHQERLTETIGHLSGNPPKEPELTEEKRQSHRAKLQKHLAELRGECPIKPIEEKKKEREDALKFLEEIKAKSHN